MAGASFDPVALARLEERMGGNGEDIRDLRKEIEDRNKSQDELKKRVQDNEVRWLEELSGLRVYIAEKFGELKGRADVRADAKGDWKWVITSGVSLAALVFTVLWNVLRK